MGSTVGTGVAEPVMRWRLSWQGRAGAYFCALLMAFFAVVGITATQLSLAVLGAVGAAVGLRVAMYSSLVLTSDTLEIRNVFGARVVALASISAVTPGYSGITITTEDGHSYTALAVQKANLSTWRGRPTRADKVASAVRRAAGLVPAGEHTRRGQ
jgi:hypothetical protein